MASPTERIRPADLQFGLIFFSSCEVATPGDLYRLVVESARFADGHGFSSVWIPERHFTKDGWLYPNPAVLHAALARETKQIHLRAGSVVVPLHHPIRIVEEWAMVDNLSGGRVGLSFASGWHPNDFVFFPEKYANRRQEMYQSIELVRKLWEREPIVLRGGDGKWAEVQAYPDPVQRKLPVWITAAGNPGTFVKAGEIGANLLTHMFNHNVEELGRKIRLYRDALGRHGHDPHAGQVTVMLHTFVTDDPALIDDPVRGAFCRYLKSASYLLDAIASSRGQTVDLGRLSEQDVDEYVQFVFNRLVSDRRILFGTPEACLDLMGELRAAGVDEIACQLDFGVETGVALASLPHLHRLKEQCAGERLNQVMARLATDTVDGPQTTISDHDHLSGLTEQPRVIQGRCHEEVSGVAFYRRLRERKVQFGTRFQGVEWLWRRDGEALGRVRIADGLHRNSDVYKVHPAFLDACFQVLYAALPVGAAGNGESALHLPIGVRSFRLHARPGSEVWSHAVLRSGVGSVNGCYEGDVRLLDLNGVVVAEARGLQLREAERSVPQSSQPNLDDLCYELAWQVAGDPHQVPAWDAPPPDEQGIWLILADAHGVGDALGALLGAQGRTCILVRSGPQFEAVDAGRARVRAGSREHMERLIDGVSRAHDMSTCCVVHLWSLDAAPPDAATVDDLVQAQTLGCGSVLHLVQSLARMEVGRWRRLWLVTRGAQPVAGSELALAVAQAPLWGFGRTLAHEHPDTWGGLVDLDPESSSEDAARDVLRAVRSADGEDQLAFRNRQPYVARFVRKAVAAERPSAARLRPDSSYLITGGVGDLGLVVARWMAERGARHLVLLARTPLPPRSTWDGIGEGSRPARQVAAIRALEAQGVDVRIAAVDVADEAQLTAFLTAFKHEGRPRIRGLVHTAAATDGGIILKLQDSALAAVMRPKVQGGWLLHQSFDDAELDFFVLFSAIPSLLGWLGQGAANYAAANAFLDALAHHRRAKGQPALSIAWGPWREVGLAERATGGLERLAAEGIGSVSPQQGQAIMEQLLAIDSPQVAVVAVDWPRLLRAAPKVLEVPLLAHFAREAANAPSLTARATGDGARIRQALTAMGASERHSLLVSYACDNVARVLHVPAARLDPDQPLNKLGIDSLMAIELRNRIEGDLGVRIPMVAFLQGPSIHELAVQVLAQLDAAPMPSDTIAGEAHGAKGSGPATRPMMDGQAERLLAELDQLSEAEVESLLNKLVMEPRDPQTRRPRP